MAATLDRSMAKVVRLWMVTSLGLVTALAACSSGSDDREATVGTETAADRADDESGSEMTLAAEVMTSASPGGTATPGASTATTARPSEADPAAPSPTPARAARIPAGDDAHGVTDSQLEVGIAWGSAGAAGAAAGAIGGVNAGAAADSYGGDTQGQAQAVVDFINEHGGVAGRELVPVWFEVNVSELLSPEGRAREAARACASWTEDHEVFTFITGVGQTRVMVGCAANSKTPYIDAAVSQVSERYYDEIAPYYYKVNAPLTDRRDRAYVEGLWDQGFFPPDARVGVLVEAKPDIVDGFERGMAPALAAHGIEVVARVDYPDFIDSPWANYVLQFQQQGVTHVLFSTSESGSWPPLFFMRAADNARYRPRYGLASDNAPISQETNGPDSQLVGTKVVTYRPLRVGEEPVSPNDTRCRAIMKERGYGEQGFGWNGICDPLFFLDHALDLADEVSASGLARGVAGLGTSYPPVTFFGSEFGPDRPDGPSLGRPAAYDESCSCFAYTGPLYPLP